MDDRSPKNRRPAPAARGAKRPAEARREPMSRDEIRNVRYRESMRKRRIRQLILYAVGAVLLAALAVVLSLTVFFKISSFEVRGDEVYAAEDVIAATGLSQGNNMFRFDRESVEELVTTQLPYVSSLEIKRSPTGKITLGVTAAHVAMAIDFGDSYTLLDKNCKVLETGVQSINENVAVIKSSAPLTAESGHTAEFENKDDTELLCRIYQTLSEGGLEKITQIDITDPTNVRLKYDMRITLKIGVPSSLEGKIEFITATLKKLDADEPSFTGTMDFTIDNKAFVNDVDDEETTQAPPEETAPGEIPSDEAPQTDGTEQDGAENNG